MPQMMPMMWLLLYFFAMIVLLLVLILVSGGFWIWNKRLFTETTGIHHLASFFKV